MTRLVLASALAVLAAVQLLPAQQLKSSGPVKHAGPQRPAAGFILGRVVDAGTNQPIGNATVSLGRAASARGQATPPPAAVNVYTTSDGYFLFRDLPAGSYTITSTAAGYLAGGLGQRRPMGGTQPYALAEGERAASLVIRMWREAVISGTISDEAGDPIAGVAVALLRRDQLTPGPVVRTAIRSSAEFAYTDAAGAYRLYGLPPGEYVLSVPNRMTQLPASLAGADQAAIDRMRAGGFSALASGLRWFGPAVRLGDMLIQTSDQGSWAGSNALAARLPATMKADGTVTAYPPTFFPGTTVPSQASVIALTSGDERTGVDLQLKPMSLGRLSGRLSGPDGPMGGLAVHLFPAFAVNTTLERTHEIGVTVTAADGGFSFLAVPPGEYVMKAWRLTQASSIGAEPLPAEPSLWASVPVSVAAGSTRPVGVVLRPGAAIRGKIVLDGNAAPGPFGRFQTVLSVAFEPAWSQAFSARLATRVSANLEFLTNGLPPGEYFPILPNQFVNPGLGWYFESATRGGQDLMLSPLVIESSDVNDVVLTFSDRRTTLSGVVSDAAGRPTATGAVVVFPADYQAWIKHGMQAISSWVVAVAQNGSFTLDVRPGTYLIAAIDEERLDDWRRETTIAALAAQATRVTLARGDAARHELRLIALRTP
jgi:hypothetical protein